MKTKCPHCNTTLPAPAGSLGKKAKCNHCGNAFVIKQQPASPDGVGTPGPFKTSLRATLGVSGGLPTKQAPVSKAPGRPLRYFFAIPAIVYLAFLASDAIGPMAIIPASLAIVILIVAQDIVYRLDRIDWHLTNAAKPPTTEVKK